MSQDDVSFGSRPFFSSKNVQSCQVFLFFLAKQFLFGECVQQKQIYMFELEVNDLMHEDTFQLRWRKQDNNKNNNNINFAMQIKKVIIAFNIIFNSKNTKLFAKRSLTRIMCLSFCTKFTSENEFEDK